MTNLWKRRAREPEATVQRAEAQLDDSAALDRLLEHLPEAGEVRPRLSASFFARAWDPEARRDYWVTSDGLCVTCYTLSGITLQQAAGVRVRWDALRGRAALTEELLADLVAKETGSSVTLVSVASKVRKETGVERGG
ncbi:MAG TPA: hypothetical protein VMD49_01260 [Steroidobacteraceae bacterium]|nr:hypothetical protein [Steroidobacteraceae bacterium]